MTASFSEQFRITSKLWVDADAAANILEETKSAVLAEMMLAHADIAVNRAEMLTKASPQWKEHIEKMVNARSAANRLKVQLEYIRMRFSEQQSTEATRRREMGL